ncbi:unnamed protein product (mitochondrion) [Plasmodiophora brassicae]|uniref:Uncharacterized protein n=1 Tax=Plasmodiophora brassicae TaxID=37360 RepID=A0A3P3Y8L5_PLABS|nr:unnamed protein product [Plasmodiophora brassicae]
MAEEESQWVVEPIDEAATQAAIEAENDSDASVDDDDREDNGKKRTMTARKRARLEKMNKEAKRKRHARFTRNPMHGMQTESCERQAESLQGMLSSAACSLDTLSAADFISPNVLPKDRAISDSALAVKAIQKDWRKKLLGPVHPCAGSLGAPVLLVVTYAATRAVDFVRALKPLQNKKAAIAKLFAKHIKVDEQIAALNADVRIAVEHVVIDMGLDAKQMNLFDIAAVRDDFLGLFSKYLHANLLSCGGNIRLCLY